MSLRNPGFPNLDALRPQSGRGPLHQTRQYGQGEAVPAPAPREDLKFNPGALQPLRQVPQEDLTYVADTMRYGDFSHIAFTVGTTGLAQPILTRAPGKRIYLLIENTHAANNLFVGFGINNPSANAGVTIAPGGNYLLDAVVAQNDVWVVGSAAGTTGKITYCNQDYGRG